MACNCIHEICERIRNELPDKNQKYEGINILNVGCDCLSFIERGNKMCGEITIPYTINHEPIGRKKKTTIYMTTKYCPFCGKKYEDSKVE